MEFYSVIIHFSDLLTSWWSEFLIQLVVTLISVFGALGVYKYGDRQRKKNSREKRKNKLIKLQSYLINNIQFIEHGIQTQYDVLIEFNIGVEFLLNIGNKINKGESIESIKNRSVILSVEFNSADIFNISSLGFYKIFVESKSGDIEKNTTRYLNFKNYLNHIIELRESILIMRKSEIDMKQTIENEFDQIYSEMSLEFNKLIENQENLKSDFMKRIADIFHEERNKEYSKYRKMTNGDYSLFIRNYLMILPLVHLFSNERDEKMELATFVYHIRKSGAVFKKFEYRLNELLEKSKSKLKLLSDLKREIKEARKELENLEWTPEYI
jgi:hypothetical protein